MWKTCGKYTDLSENFPTVTFSTCIHMPYKNPSAEKWKTLFQVSVNKRFVVSTLTHRLCKNFCRQQDKTVFN